MFDLAQDEFDPWCVRTCMGDRHRKVNAAQDLQYFTKSLAMVIGAGAERLQFPRKLADMHQDQHAVIGLQGYATAELNAAFPAFEAFIHQVSHARIESRFVLLFPPAIFYNL